MTSADRPDPFAEPGAPLLHARDYVVRAYRHDDGAILVRGAVRDVVPADFYDDDDLEPLVMHHMVVDLVVDAATLEIRDVRVVFEEFPHGTCPSIADHYTKLVGVPVGRGFTQRVRELFGGPRGCTHTTALLQAMAPVVVQAHLRSRLGSGDHAFGERLASPEGRAKRVAGNRNTCHVWAEDGEHVAALERGATMLPLPIVRRLQQRGIDPERWPRGENVRRRDDGSDERGRRVEPR